MGVDYHYVNHDKQQHFPAMLFEWNARGPHLGTGPGARALVLLLGTHGSWHGDRIAVVGDASEEFQEFFCVYTNIETEAELILIDFDGFRWVEDQIDADAKRRHDSQRCTTFSRLCCYAMHLLRQDIARFLDEKYGEAEWYELYEKSRLTKTDLWSRAIIEAGNRNLEIRGSY